MSKLSKDFTVIQLFIIIVHGMLCIQEAIALILESSVPEVDIIDPESSSALMHVRY